MFVKTIVETKHDDLITVAPTDLIQDVARLFRREHIGFALVKDTQGNLLGSVSERDIIHALADRGDLSLAHVEDVLTVNVVTCDINESLETARQIMTHKRTRHVVVMENDAIAGLVSIGDLIKHSLDECRIDTTEMVGYINGQGYN